MKRKDFYLNVVKLVAKNRHLHNKVPKFRDVNAVLEAVKEDISVLDFAAKSIRDKDPRLAFIYDNVYTLKNIFNSPERYLGLTTEFFKHKDFIDVAKGVVKQSLKNSLAKVEGVNDDYVETVKKLINAIENKTNKEYKKIELEKEQEEARRIEKEKMLSKNKENREKAIELIEGFNLETKNITETDDLVQPSKIKFVKDDDEHENKVPVKNDDGRSSGN